MADKSSLEAKNRSLAIEAALVGVIVAAAAAVRFYDLGRLPPGLWYDEALNGLNALALLRDKAVRVYFDNREFFGGAKNAQEPMFHYFLAAAIALMGPTVLALRAASAAIGVVTVGAFYAMVRTIWGRRTALLAALLLAFFRWHFHFSRIAFRTVLTPLLICLFLALWWSGKERNSGRRLVLSGVFLGLGFYTYPAFQLIVPAWLGYVGLWYLRDRDRRGQVLRTIVQPALAALVVLLPLLVYLVRNPDVVSGRIGTLSAFDRGWAAGSRMILENLWANVHQFWWRGDHVAKHNVPFMAVFDRLTGAVFALGLVATVAGVRKDSRNALVLLWVAFLACASVFSFGAPNLLRTLGMAPAVVLILASGYLKVGQAVERLLSRQTAAFVLAVLIAWFAGNELYRYFEKWRKNPEVPVEFLAHYRSLGEAIEGWGEQVEVHMPRPLLRHCTFRYLLHDRSNLRELVMPDSLVRTPGARRDRVLVFIPAIVPLDRLSRGWVVWRTPPDMALGGRVLELEALRIPADQLMTRSEAVEALRRVLSGRR